MGVRIFLFFVVLAIITHSIDEEKKIAQSLKNLEESNRNLQDCSPGCLDTWPSDGICDELCDNEACNYDNGDCDCSPGCHNTIQGDGVCDEDCNNHSCNYDDGDCSTPEPEVDVDYSIHFHFEGSCDNELCFMCSECVFEDCSDFCSSDCGGCLEFDSIPEWCVDSISSPDDDDLIQQQNVWMNVFFQRYTNEQPKCDVNTFLNVHQGVIGNEALDRFQLNNYLCQCDVQFYFPEQMRCLPVVNEFYHMLTLCGHVDDRLFESNTGDVWRIGEIVVFASFLGVALFQYC